MLKKAILVFFAFMATARMMSTCLSSTTLGHSGGSVNNSSNLFIKELVLYWHVLYFKWVIQIRVVHDCVHKGPQIV